MTRSLQAIFEKGVLRPLEPLALQEQQQVTVTVSDEGPSESALLDSSFLRYLESQADESVTLDQVRSALAKIPGSMIEDFRQEREERS
jgi:predicted DNA-binding antitoxin AbrB/MazE fold protein